MCGGKYNLIPSHPHRPRVMSPNLTTVGLNYSETKFQILARITFCFVDWDYILKHLKGYFAGSQGQGAKFFGSNQIWHKMKYCDIWDEKCNIQWKLMVSTGRKYFVRNHIIPPDSSIWPWNMSLFISPGRHFSSSGSQISSYIRDNISTFP